MPAGHRRDRAPEVVSSPIPRTSGANQFTSSGQRCPNPLSQEKVFPAIMLPLRMYPTQEVPITDVVSDVTSAKLRSRLRQSNCSPSSLRRSSNLMTLEARI